MQQDGSASENSTVYQAGRDVIVNDYRDIMAHVRLMCLFLVIGVVVIAALLSLNILVVLDTQTAIEQAHKINLARMQ